jgi:hypothetical protein
LNRASRLCTTDAGGPAAQSRDPPVDQTEYNREEKLYEPRRLLKEVEGNACDYAQ